LISLHKLVGPAIPAAEILPVDVVLISHDHHSDNLDQSGRELPMVQTTTDGVERLGGTAAGLEPSDGVDLDGGVRIAVVLAHHGPPDGWQRSGLVIGFVLSGPRLPRTCVSGDHASPDLVAEIAAEHGPFDPIVLFAGGAQVPEARGPDVKHSPSTPTSWSRGPAISETPRSSRSPRGLGPLQLSPAALEVAFTEANLTDRLVSVHPGVTLTG
jgi:hypothetical protein